MLLAFSIGLVVYYWWPFGQRSLHDPEAIPRAVTARGDLAEDEKSTIAIFKQASPSVVYITSLSVHRDSFTLNVQEIPEGTGSGFVWDKTGRHCHQLPRRPGRRGVASHPGRQYHLEGPACRRCPGHRPGRDQD